MLNNDFKYTSHCHLRVHTVPGVLPGNICYVATRQHKGTKKVVHYESEPE